MEIVVSPSPLFGRHGAGLGKHVQEDLDLADDVCAYVGDWIAKHYPALATT
jgi:hypothetical protein